MSKVPDVVCLKWFAKPNDVIGGWCVTYINGLPSQGVPEIGDFLSEGTAMHIVALHNSWLQEVVNYDGRARDPINPR